MSRTGRQGHPGTVGGSTECVSRMSDELGLGLSSVCIPSEELQRPFLITHEGCTIKVQVTMASSEHLFVWKKGRSRILRWALRVKERLLDLVEFGLDLWDSKQVNTERVCLKRTCSSNDSECRRGLCCRHTDEGVRFVLPAIRGEKDGNLCQVCDDYRWRTKLVVV